MPQINKRVAKLARSLLILLVIALLAYTLGWSKILVVKEITISGTNQSELITNRIVGSKAGLEVGKPLARLNLAAAKKSIEQIDWVSKSSISRNWLSGKIAINVVERIPVAVFASPDGQAKYLDSQGMEFSSDVAPDGLPRIDVMGNALETKKFAAKFVAGLPGELLSAMTGLMITGDLKANMTTSLRKPELLIQWGSGEELSTKIELLNRLLVLPENKKITSLDLSNPNSPIVK